MTPKTKLDAALLLGGRPVPLAGPPLEIHEATPLDFSFPKGKDGRLFVAGIEVPMAGGRADSNWVLEARREQWVGELDLVVHSAGPGGPGAPGGKVVRPRVVVLPRRATLEGFAFLVDQFRAWAGAGSLADPAGRARIWAELAPRIPGREEERALVALALLRRALPAFAGLHRTPATVPAGRFECRRWSARPGGASCCAGCIRSTRPGRWKRLASAGLPPWRWSRAPTGPRTAS